MKHSQIMDKVTAANIRISVAGSDLDVRSDQPLTADQLEFLKQHKATIIAELRSEAEGDSNLLETLAAATNSLPITPAEVRDALAPEDIEDWRNGEISGDTLAAFARSLVQRREMDQGKIPVHYTEHATCAQCWPIWAWFSGDVDGCPWCWNRAAGRPIPRPQSVQCGKCMHFERIDHPHLGHCAKGEPEAIAGLWGTDRHECTLWHPLEKNAGD